MEKKNESLYDIFKQYNAVKEGDAKQKQNLSYVSWAAIWEEVLKVDPEADWNVITDEHSNLYHTDGKTCDVRVEVTIKGLKRQMSLPVMDHRNNSIPLESVTSRNVNDSIQRCFVKCCAKFGLGLSVYRGETDTEYEKDLAEAELIEAMSKCNTLEDLQNVYKYYVGNNQKLGGLPSVKTAYNKEFIRISNNNKKEKK